MFLDGGEKNSGVGGEVLHDDSSLYQGQVSRNQTIWQKKSGKP